MLFLESFRYFACIPTVSFFFFFFNSDGYRINRVEIRIERKIKKKENSNGNSQSSGSSKLAWLVWPSRDNRLVPILGTTTLLTNTRGERPMNSLWKANFAVSPLTGLRDSFLSFSSFLFLAYTIENSLYSVKSKSIYLLYSFDLPIEARCLNTMHGHEGGRQGGNNR